MVNRILVTTALEESWPENGPILFLGEWCQRYSRKLNWEKRDFEVLPYHWDDRAKLYNDYQYLQKLYESLLLELQFKLNEIHGVDHSVRYWRILIGPWLGYFVQMLFDRWTSIQHAVKDYELDGTIVLFSRKNELVPNDTKQFMELFIDDDWNHLIYSTILKEYTNVNCIQKNAISTFNNEQVNTKDLCWKKIAKQRVVLLYSRFASLLMKKNDIFLLKTYMPYLNELRMHLSLGQMPQYWQSVSVPHAVLNENCRQWKLDGVCHSLFETFLRKMIVEQIPANFLEGYDLLANQTRCLAWPKDPKLIFTSNAEIADDVFKKWAALKVEQGALLVIGQHGGHFGNGKWSFVEEHQMAICNHYLSWGWSEECNAKILPIGQLKNKKSLGVDHSQRPKAILVVASIPRYSYWMSSIIVSRQWLSYFAEQCRFVEHLPLSIREILIVRLYSKDFGWDQMLRWRDRFPNMHIDDGQTNIKNLLSECRIYISTYNATTYLESFTMNIPTVIYWNSNHWELRQSAIPYFDELKKVGIFHETPESAAAHIATVWDDVDNWWSSPEVSKVLDQFKSQYCDLSKSVFSKIKTTLKEILYNTEGIKENDVF